MNPTACDHHGWPGSLELVSDGFFQCLACGLCCPRHSDMKPSDFGPPKRFNLDFFKPVAALYEERRKSREMAGCS